jgi:5-methylcytosine-specific restriction enzyme subunit McrC
VSSSTQAPPTLVLREFESCEAALAADVAAVLRSRYAGRIDVAPTERAGVYRLSARDYVGRIGLPGGGVLVVRPKVEVANLFYMLCSDAGLAEFNPPPTGLQSNSDNPDIASFVAEALVASVERLLASGIYRGYVPQEESVPLVRGRILIGQQVSRYAELKHRHVCAYTDLTADTPENRVVVAALRLAIPLLNQKARTVRQARAQLGRLEGVSSVSARQAIALLRTISLHRLNAAYGPAIGLCRLLLHHLSFDERAGPHPYASFLVNMPRLFEGFLTARLRALLPRHGLRGQAQRHDYLDEERTVGIRPDLLVYASRGGPPLLVLDFKYRRLDEPDTSPNSDLYQLSAYMDRYALRPGMLVYPRFETFPTSQLKLKGTAKQLHLATVDLAAPSPAALETECERLGETIAGAI